MPRSKTRLTHVSVIVIAGAMGLSPIMIGSASARIKSTAHDFSTKAWSSGSICKPCHTSHNANTTIEDGYLWNHELTNATYILYDSPTLEEQPDNPGPNSRLCLSCHDGTVAIDAFSGRAGSEFITGAALLTTDLSNDHPVGIQWTHQEGGNCTFCHSIHGGGSTLLSSTLRFYDGKIECGTCHDAHDTAELQKFLRVPLEGSQICEVCHDQ